MRVIPTWTICMNCEVSPSSLRARCFVGKVHIQVLILHFAAIPVGRWRNKSALPRQLTRSAHIRLDGSLSVNIYRMTLRSFMSSHELAASHQPRSFSPTALGRANRCMRVDAHIKSTALVKCGSRSSYPSFERHHPGNNDRLVRSAVVF